MHIRIKVGLANLGEDMTLVPALDELDLQKNA